MRLIDADALKKDDELTEWITRDTIRTGKMLKAFSMIVNICGIPHGVDFVDDTFANMDTNFGLITYSKCCIRINKNMPEDLQHRTLIHEMVHGMLLHIGREDLSQDETFVQMLAMALDEGFEIKYLEKGGE